MSLELILMSLMSLGGHFLVYFREQVRLMSWGAAFDEFGRGFGTRAWR